MHSEQQKRYAALLVPRFRLQSVLLQTHSIKANQTEIPKPHQPVALLDSASTRGMLLEVSESAETFGITPGMHASQALARSPQLILLPASTTAEESLLQRLLHFVESLTPRAEKKSNALWLLDLRGIHSNNWTVWGNQALDRLLQSEGIQACLGIAPRPSLALCAVRRATPLRIVEESESFLEELRFEELGTSPNLLKQLHDWGISTLGELLRLPRQDALERLGPEATMLWEIARDSRESILRLETFPEPLELAVDFEHPIETVAPLVFSIHRMIEQLCSRMRLLQRVASAMELHLHLDNAATHARSFTVPAPTRTDSVLLRILETHLETLHFDASITRCALKIEASTPSSQQLALFENPLRDPNRFGETLARIRALVGEDSVGVPLLKNTHRQDSFTLGDPLVIFSQPETLESDIQNRTTATNGTALGLPLRRFRPARKAEVKLQSHRPVHLSARHIHGPVLECRGPFRFSGDWWHKEPWQTEQWDVLLGGKMRGLYRLSGHSTSQKPVPQPSTWFIDGCYDGTAWPENNPNR